MSQIRLYAPSESRCGICRGDASPRITLRDTAVCEGCLRRLNADHNAKRSIMFAHFD